MYFSPLLLKLNNDFYTLAIIHLYKSFILIESLCIYFLIQVYFKLRCFNKSCMQMSIKNPMLYISFSKHVVLLCY